MGMIKTDRELVFSKNLLKDLDESIEKYVPPKNISPFLKDIGIIGHKAFREDIANQIKEYEDIKSGNIPSYFFEINNLGILLIALRIKNGISQTELAEKLEVSQSQVSRDENNDYYGVKNTTVLRILNALGENIRLNLLNK